MKENLTKKNLITIIVLALFVFAVFYSQNKKPVANVVSDMPNVPSNLNPTDQEKANQEIKDINNKINTNTCFQKKGTVACYEEYLQRGIKYESLGELSNAINSYQKAAEISPKDYVPYSNIGSAYYGLQKFPEAETAFLKALTLTPNNVSVYTKLYDLYFLGMRRSTEQMTGFFKDAMKNTNNSIDIVKLYASYLENISNFESALSVWQSLLEFEPDNLLYKTKIEALREKVLP